MSERPLISVVCPCYSMAGRGAEMLRELLWSINAQRYKDVEVIVCDSSDSGEIAKMCFLFDARWVEGKEGAAAKFNIALDHAQGEIIKPMCQDDKFMEPDTLQKIADAFSAGPEPWFVRSALSVGGLTYPQWIACTSHNAGEPQFREYDHVPYPHRDLHSLRTGENTYGSPSAMAWRKNDLRFDENLNWLLDCEFYSRMAERYGVPTFVDTPIYIRQWSGQVTHQIGGHQRILDTNYVIEKYRDRGGVAR